MKPYIFERNLTYFTKPRTFNRSLTHSAPLSPQIPAPDSYFGPPRRKRPCPDCQTGRLPWSDPHARSQSGSGHRFRPCSRPRSCPHSQRDEPLRASAPHTIRPGRRIGPQQTDTRSASGFQTSPSQPSPYNNHPPPGRRPGDGKVRRQPASPADACALNSARRCGAKNGSPAFPLTHIPQSSFCRRRNSRSGKMRTADSPPAQSPFAPEGIQR